MSAPGSPDRVPCNASIASLTVDSKATLLVSGSYAPSKDNCVDVAFKYGNFLYQEFIYTIEYIQMSKASQQQKIAYTRLKQRISELEQNNNC